VAGVPTVVAKAASRPNHHHHHHHIIYHPHHHHHHHQSSCHLEKGLKKVESIHKNSQESISSSN